MRTDDRLYPAYLATLRLFLLHRSPGCHQLYISVASAYWLARDGQLDI